MATIASLIVDVAANVARLQTDMNKATNIVQGFAKSAKTIMGGLGVYFGSQQIFDMSQMAVQFEQSKQAFKGMAESMGADAERTFSRVKELSGGMIDNKALTESMNKALSLGIPIEKLGDLMQIARAKSRDMGITATQAFNDIATGIGRASPMILDNLGLTLKIEEANQKYAESLGKSAEFLTAQEKKMAVLNATLDAGKEALSRHNLEIKTNYEKLQTLTAGWEDLKLAMGKGFIRVALGAVSILSGLAGVFMLASAGVYKLAEGLNWVASKVTWGQTSKNFAAMKDNAKSVAEEAMRMADGLFKKTTEYWTAAWADNTPQMKIAPKITVDTTSLQQEQDRVKTSLTARSEEYKKYYSELKAMQNDYKSAIEKSLKEIADIDKNILQSRYETQKLLSDISVKGAGLNEMESYNAKVQQLNGQLTYAMQLSGDDRIKVLQDYQNAWANMVQQIDYTDIERKFDLSGGLGSSTDWINVEVKKTWLSLQDSAKIAASAVSEAGKLIDQTQMDMRATAEAQLNLQVQAFNELSNAVNTADQWVQYLKNTIAELDKGLINPRTFNLDCTAAIAQLKQVLDLSNQVAMITGMNNNKMMGDSTSGYTITNPQVLDSFATGTDYVPRTGLYKLHEGEKVTPANQNNGFGAINITINGSVENPSAMAKKLVAEMEKEMNRRNVLRA